MRRCDMTKRVIDLRTDEEKAAWIKHKRIEDEAMVKGIEAMLHKAVQHINEAEATGTCPRCDNPAGDEDRCPFEMEIHDEDIPCKCCDDCRHQCAMDI